MSTVQVGVYIVSANRLLRESLSRILNNKSNLRAASAHKFTPESLKSLGKTSPSVLLFDSTSFGFDEMAAVCGTGHQTCEWKTIVLGIEENEQVFIRLVRRGVRGFLLKDASAMDVVAAVRAVAGGEVVCPPRLCQFLFEHVMRESPRIMKGSGVLLSRREMQLVPLIARGLTNKEIAARLGLAEQTVKNHVHNILRKTEVEDRQGVLDACRRQGAAIPVETEQTGTSSSTI